MTLSVATTTERRKQRPRRTFFAAAAALLSAVATETTALTWPAPQYQQTPVAFAEEVLQATPWSKQQEILQALTKPRARVACASGHKIGKSTLAAMAALWFYCSFPDARVVMSSVTDRQVNAILWREVKKLLQRAGRCEDCRARDQWGFSRCEECDTVRPIAEEPGVLARTGLKSSDFRELVGFTAKEAEAVAGVSGANLLYILDEASGIPEEIFEAIDGNRAGGARVLMISNPTRNEGRFFHAFHDGKEHWKTFTISSEESPNVTAGCEIIPGLAVAEWVAEMREEWGEDSALFQVRVRGRFATREENKIIPLALLEEAEARWEDTPDGDDRLNFGVDVARGGDEGNDESSAAARRGPKILTAPRTWRGLDGDALAAVVVQWARELRRPGERRPAVKVDACGKVGIEAVAAFKKYEREIEVFAVDVSAKAHLPTQYLRLRDQIWFGASKWLREGGALPTDPKLAAELHASGFKHDEQSRICIDKKDKLRALLKRSPDRADGVILAIYEPPAQKVADERSREDLDDLLDQADADGGEPSPYRQRGPSPYAQGASPYGRRPS